MTTQGILAGTGLNGKTNLQLERHVIVVQRWWHDGGELRGVFVDENRALAFLEAIARRDNRLENRTWRTKRDVRRPLTAEECEAKQLVAGWTSDYSTWVARRFRIQ